MSLILLLLGVLITGAGVMTIAFGAPSHSSAIGQTLIIAGAIGLVGGALLIGLAAMVRQMRAIAEALRARPAIQAAGFSNAKQLPELPRHAPERRAEVPPQVEPPRLPDTRPPDPRLPDPRPEPRPVEAPPAAAIEVSGNALERLRASMVRPDRVVTNGEDVPLSPNGGGPHPLSESKLEPDARPGGPAEGAREPRLDFLFRAKTPPRPPHPPEVFDSMWPRRRGPADQPKPDEVARQAPPAGPAEEPRPQPERPPRSVAILKSGVVDGMAYTLYADGSIEAQLPHGTVRFGSIAELRAHIENNS
jgi:hypothetical protein